MAMRKDYWKEQWVQFGEELNTSKDYFVSNYGDVKSRDKTTGEENLLKLSTLQRGHVVVGISVLGAPKNNRSKSFYVQKLVAEAFCQNDFDEDTKVFIVHIDYDLSNNFFMNLKYVDRAGQTKHFQLHEKGLWDPKRREKNPQAKMNPDSVRLLKQRLKEGDAPKSHIAKSFDITKEQLRKIEKGLVWAWVEDKDK